MFWFYKDGQKQSVFSINFLKIVIGTLVTILGGIWLFYETEPHPYRSGMISFAVLLTIVYLTLTFRKPKNPELLSKIQEVQNNLTRLKNATKDIIKEEHYYKLIFLSWNLKNDYEKSHVRDITGEDSKDYNFTVQSPLNYIISITHGIINRLTAHDVFRTISNVDFWRHITEDKSFLEANITAVRENGVRIDRIVLLDRKVLELPNSHEKKAVLQRTITALYDFYTLHKEAFTDRLLWQFYVSDNYANDNENPVPYAIIINTIPGNNDCMFMHPNISTNGAYQMNLRFGRGMSDINIVTQQVKFEYFKGRTLLSIEQIYKKMFDKDGEWNLP